MKPNDMVISYFQDNTITRYDNRDNDFVSLVVSFVRIPENSSKDILIQDYIVSNPRANSSDVLEYMISELGMANNPSNQELVIA